MKSSEIIMCRALYFLCILPIVTFYTRANEIRSALTVSTEVWGFCLTAIPIGTIVTSRLLARQLDRWRLPVISAAAIAATALLTALTAYMNSSIGIAILLVCAGAFNGVTQVAINKYSHQLDIRSGRMISSSCHGYFSIGVLFASLISLAATHGSVEPVHHMTIVSIVVCALCAVVGLHSARDSGVTAANEFQNGIHSVRGKENVSAAMICTAFLIVFCETAINAWHSVLIQGITGTALSSTVSYCAYAAGTVLIRFSGDRFRQRFGMLASVVYFGPVAVILLLTGIWFREAAVIVVAMFATGLCLGLAFPDLLKKAAAASPEHSTLRIGIITAYGSIGFLVMGPTIGMATQYFGIREAFALLCILLLAVTVLVVSTRKIDHLRATEVLASVNRPEI